MSTKPIEIWFITSKSGQRQAWHFSFRAGRAGRIAMAKAELMLATGVAVETRKPEWL